MILRGEKSISLEILSPRGKRGMFQNFFILFTGGGGGSKNFGDEISKLILFLPIIY